MNKLKNNNPFKLLIYTLFFITCSVGFILGYVLLDMYEAGIFQGRSESELRAELERAAATAVKWSWSSPALKM